VFTAVAGNSRCSITPGDISGPGGSLAD